MKTVKDKSKEDKLKAILFLGSGATAGSGIKKNGEQLPTDGKFFCSKVVKSLMEHYPALKLIRDEKKSLEHNELYKTWNDIYIYRGLARQGIIREERNVIDKFYNLANYSWSKDYEWRRKHYRHQFKIIDASHHPDYYLAELAIWDLRVLVKEVYDKNYGKKKKKSAYKEFWKGLNGKVSAVANLNYDTTFDDSFGNNKPFYYPCDSKPSTDKIPLIRPHGSLKWTSQSHRSISQNRWLGWTSSYNSYDLSDFGYKSSDNHDILEFKQSLIVSPAEFKEEIVGSSSLAGLTNPILLLQWIELEKQLRESNHWIFYGISFASGDDHLLFLLRNYYDGGKKIHCSYLTNDKSNDKSHIERLSKDVLGQDGNICEHEIKDGKISSFHKKDCVLYCNR